MMGQYSLRFIQRPFFDSERHKSLPSSEDILWVTYPQLLTSQQTTGAQAVRGIKELEFS